MAFNGNKIGLIGGFGGFSIFAYDSTADASTAVRASGYMSDYASFLTVGDQIFAKCSDGNFGFRVVSNAAGVVDLGDATAIGVTTDTD